MEQRRDAELIPGLGEARGNETAPGQRQGRIGGPLRRRKRVILTVVLAAALAAVGGLVASTAIKSPAQIAAQTSPPPLTVLTAPVTRQVVSSTVIAQGLVSQPAEFSGPVSFDSAGLNAQGAAAGGTLPVVTRIFLPPGHAVSAGDVLAEISGQPLFVFQGSVPVYRNLGPGESGTDVAQLQEGLASIGFPTGADQIGTYGPGTAAAVAAYYQSIGYHAVMATGQTKADDGAMVPQDEIMFVPRFPDHVVRYAEPVGQEATAPFATLSMGSPVISGQLDPSAGGLVQRGMKVSISGGNGAGQSTSGTVTSVSEQTQSQASIAGGQYLPVTITPGRPLPVSMIGQDVLITITTAHSDGMVLAVPEAAIFASANGATYITKITGRSQVRVPVRIGVTGSGLVEVIPQGGAALAAGDAVLTGEGYARPGGSSTAGQG